MMKKVLVRVLGVILLLVIGVLLFWPVSIVPDSFQTKASPIGQPPFEHNNALAAARIIPVDGVGPEAIIVGPDGRLYSGLADGKIIAINPETGEIEELVNTQGRPLGMVFDAYGNLIICDVVKGLLKLTPENDLIVLVDSYQGKKMVLVDDLDIAADGTIWFSDAIIGRSIAEGVTSLIENKPSGRLFKYDPRTGELELILDELAFANGVAMSADGSFVLVNETHRYRIRRVWVTGDKAGSSDLFAENLPGFPDNVTRSADGTFWVALIAPRLELFDNLSDKPFLRKVMYRMIKFLPDPAPSKHSWAVQYDAQGNVLQSLDAKDDADVYMVTNVKEQDGKLYISSLEASSIGILELPQRNPQ